MLQVQSPFSKLILLSSTEPTVLANVSLKGKIENLLDILKIRTIEKGIEYTSMSLHDEIFDLRIELLKFLVENEPDLFAKLQQQIIDDIAHKLYYTGKYKALGESISDVLEVYLKIVNHIALLFDEQSMDKGFSDIAIPSFSSLKLLLSLQPSIELENYLKWIEYSLDLDYSLIVADIVLMESIPFSEVLASELESFSKRSVIGYGSYTVINKIWNPDSADETQLIRNIKIAAAAKQLELGEGAAISSKSLRELLLN